MNKETKEAFFLFCFVFDQNDNIGCQFPPPMDTVIVQLHTKHFSPRETEN